MSVYVGNLSYEVTQDALSSVFAEYGTVKGVQVPTNRETGQPRGFAFVEMGTEAEESAAIEGLDGAEWMGRDLKVNKAKPNISTIFVMPRKHNHSDVTQNTPKALLG